MEWKDAIIFISSTFNDMHAERDYLVKEVFPELTEWCEKRHIRLTDIDLRWGVSEEDSNNSKTIETCLRHVDKSRPFFLCFLGQRRGWVPDFENDISEETKNHYGIKDLKDRYESRGDRSATEMEIEHALLKPLEIILDDKTRKTPEACRHSIFFFRNGDYADENADLLSGHQRLIYTNEYLKKVDISKVMGKLESRDPQLYESILNQLKEDFTNGTIAHPEFICELIYDIQNTDCEYFNDLIDNLVKNPTDNNNFTIISELKFKNPVIYKEIIHDIKDNDEGAYKQLTEKLDSHEYEDIGIDDFCEEFDYEIIRQIVDEFKTKNEEVFNLHNAELVNLRKLIEDKQKEADATNINCEDAKKVHVVINDYEGEWNSDLTLPELSHYKFGEGKGKLTNFESNGRPLKNVIIDEFIKQFEMEFEDHIQKLKIENPRVFEEDTSNDILDDDKRLANELDQQENFCHNNSEGFVKREEYTDKLKEYVESSDNAICLVSAEAGLGKTMLLADFATKFEKNYPNKKLYKRFCGGSDLSSKTYSLWKSIIDEAGIVDERLVPNNIIDLRRNIDDVLGEIAKNDDEVVIIIDAINQMEDGMEMLNWFGMLPDNLKLIISVKEINLDSSDENTDEKQRKLDEAYHEKLTNIKKKKTISDELSFTLNKLDYKKEENIAEYIKNITGYVESGDNDICLVSSELNYDKSLIFHIFNDKYVGGDIYNIRCILNNSGCPTDKIKKSIRQFGDKATVFNVVEITGNAEGIESKLKAHLDNAGDGIVIIDLMSNDDGLVEKVVGINHNSKTIIGIKGDYSLNGKSEHSFKITELDTEKNAIIKSYLSNYLKELDEKEIHDICNFKGSKNPLFLKILLSELRVFGSFDQLKDEIRSFGDKPLTAFEHVFDRLENDEVVRGDEAPIARPLFSLLASSRAGGLSEDEIVTIIKDEYNLDEDYVKSYVNLNLRQVRPFMARKEGRHDFFYEKFREAAEEKYKNDNEANIALLTDYFKDKSDPNNVRRYMELPYYLKESGRVDELEKTLSSYSFIKNKLFKSRDIYSLISDYDNLEFDEEDGPLELIQRGLELSSPVLMNNPEELPVQLYGRMNEIDDPVIKNLISDLENDASDMGLKPTTTVLYSPKSSIIKRLLPDGNRSSSCIAFAGNNKIIFGSSDGVLSMYDVADNSFEVLEKADSKIITMILKDDKRLYVASENGEIKKWDMETREIEEFPQISDAKLTDIYVSDTYNKIYASSHDGIFSIDLETKELKREAIDPKDYNQILVPRRNEAILVCDEREVDGWDVYEMRKAYNRHHQQNDDEASSTKLDSSEEIRFMGLNKRFLTLISENGQMKFWNTLKNSGGGESIDETRVCSVNDKFKQALTLEDENQIITISDMGVLRVYNIPEPRNPKFNIAKSEKTDMALDIQTGITSPTALEYHADGNEKWVIVGNENNDISIIDLDKKVEASGNVRHAESVFSIKIDDNHMITASNNGEIFTWDIDSEECINKFENDFRVNAISHNRQDSKLVLAGVKLEDDGKKTNLIVDCDIDDGMWRPIEIPEDNKEGKVKLEVNEPEIGMGEVIDIAQNSSGIVFLEKDKLTIGDDKFEFDLDKTEEGELKVTATTLTTRFESGDVFVGFSDGNIVKYPSGESLTKCNDSSLTKIKATDDGKLIAGYDDGDIEIFDLNGANTSLKEHEKAITNIFMRDSEMITVSKDNTLKMWDLGNNHCTYTYFLDIYATSVSLKGDKLIIGDTLGNVRFFEFQSHIK